MSHRKIPFAVSVFALSVGATVLALACGPEFSLLLYDRKAILHGPIGSSFKLDAVHLAPPPKFKFTVGTGSARYPVEPDKARAEVELSNMFPEQLKALLAMRAAPDGDAAYALGASLPLAIRLYTAGAVDFHLAQNSDDETAQTARQRAEKRFQAVLALPDAESRERATWAAFMLGRMERDDEARKAAFRRTRDLAARGFPDPLALAEASLGEEAGDYFAQEDYPRAAALYAEQASHGSEGGVNSLRMIAERLLDDRAKLKANIADPLIQKVVVSYVLGENESNRMVTLRSSEESGAKAPTPPVSWAGVETIAELGLDRIAQADRLAALAYNTGRYELAARLAKQAHGPLAAWVKAKLALRHGDTAAAARHYAEAAKAFPQLDEGIAANPRQPSLVQGERAVLLLSRGEYTQALDQFYTVGGHYWPDLAYVAERVVSTDELKAFVDAKVAKPPSPRTAQSGKENYVQPDAGAEWPASNPAAQLRDLLARRLVREGRIAEAGPYFHDAKDVRFASPSWWGTEGPHIPDSRADAESYARALRAAEHAWTGVGQARELFEAAKLARTQGMSIMGYELAPDYFIAGGMYEFETTAPDPTGRALVGKEEKTRFHASAARPDKRFHYRYVATDLALRAADALPPRSQAYAAVLCRATGWMVDRDETKAQSIYRRYLKNGALVPWASHFGHNCPEPEFDRAAKMAASNKIAPLIHPLKRHPRRAAVGAALVLILGVAWYWRRARTKVTRAAG